MKKTNTSTYIQKHVVYRFLIVLYAMYISFSPNVFALRAEAPKSVQNSYSLLRARDVSPSKILQESKERREQKHLAEKKEKIRKIRDYFNRYNLPLAEEAELFVESAEKYHIDYRLLPAIGFIESTGGKFACGKESHNAFGWHSCKKSFSSYRESIDYITKNLAGKNPKTRHFYEGKTIRGKLEAYNPPSVVSDYADKVMKQMNIISSMGE